MGPHRGTFGFIQDPLPMAVPYGPLLSCGPAGMAKLGLSFGPGVRLSFGPGVHPFGWAQCPSVLWARCPSIGWAVRPLLTVLFLTPAAVPPSHPFP